MAVRQHLVDDVAHDMRLDAFMAYAAPALSRSAAAKLIEAGEVTINGTSATNKSERVQMGDYVSWVEPEPEPASGPLRPNPIELDVRYEDDDLVVLSKQAGLVCHPATGHVDDTLANALVARYGYGHLGMLQGEERPGIVHRLDRETSGLMLAALNDQSQQALQDLIRMRTLDRRYITLVQGYVAAETGLIDTGIARSAKDRLKMAVTSDPRARQAITTFTVLERFEAGRKDDGYTLLECHLYTGRTHQIRVHMAHIHHPVVGDPLYGVKDSAKNLGLERQFLHSWHIEFDHPQTGEHLSVADTLPDDLMQAYKALNGRSMGITEAGSKILSQLGCLERSAEAL